MRETTGGHALDGTFRHHLALTAWFESAFLEIATDGALVAHHQQDFLFLGNLRQTLTHGIARTKYKRVIIEKEHADDLCTVKPFLKLRQD